MLADLPFWQKIWNRGIDITVGVLTSTISAAIIALIATWTWHWKRNRDLKYEADKQRQQLAIAEELDKQKRSEADAKRIALLKQELGPLALAFASAGTTGSADQLQAAWDTWKAWLEKNELQYLPKNREIFDAWVACNFRQANSHQTVALWAGTLTQQVRETQLNSHL